MTAPPDARLDRYLARVRAALRGLPDREIEDILGELRSHAIDLAASDGMDAAVGAMGDPLDLARTYRTETTRHLRYIMTYQGVRFCRGPRSKRPCSLTPQSWGETPGDSQGQAARRPSERSAPRLENEGRSRL